MARPEVDADSSEDRCVVLRFTNSSDEGACKPGYHLFDAFKPDWNVIRSTSMALEWLSEEDLHEVLDSINEDLERFRGYHKLSSMVVVFSTLLAIIVAVFVLPAGVALQIVALAVHIVVARQFRERCTENIQALLERDVNPAVAERGIRLALTVAGEGCFVTNWLHLEFLRLPHYSVPRPRATVRPIAVTPAQDILAPGETPTSPRVVLGMPVEDERCHHKPYPGN
jgi:hypothetical protein